MMTAEFMLSKRPVLRFTAALFSLLKHNNVDSELQVYLSFSVRSPLLAYITQCVLSVKHQFLGYIQ